MRTPIITLVALLSSLTVLPVGDITAAASPQDALVAQFDDDDFDVQAGDGLTDEQAQAIAAGAAAMMTVVTVVCVVLSVIMIVLLVLNFMAASSIPEAHQQTAPWMVFLLLVPCLNIIMLFIVLPGLAKGFQSYFNSIGRTDVGDCGAGFAIATAICMILLGPIGTILYIILTLKFNGYRKEIESGAGA